VLFAVGILLTGAVVAFVGGAGAILDQRCGASYLCDPQTADIGQDHVSRPVERPDTAQLAFSEPVTGACGCWSTMRASAQTSKPSNPS
jgi:hypothetical protein